MLKIGEIRTLTNREGNPYYEAQVFLNTLSDLKWVHNYATGCHSTDRKQNVLSPPNNNEIELLYYFKHKRYLDKFIGKLKKYMNYETVS